MPATVLSDPESKCSRPQTLLSKIKLLVSLGFAEILRLCLHRAKILGLGRAC